MQYVNLVGEAQVPLWGLSSQERLARQVKQIGNAQWIADLNELPDEAEVLLIRGDYVTEVRTLERLLELTNTVLRHPSSGNPALAIVSAPKAPQALALLRGEDVAPCEGLVTIEPAALGDFDERLRRAAPPMLEPITSDNQTRLEDRLFGSAYKGITDLVTKWLWPRPVKQVVHRLAELRVTPNAVTTVGLGLMLLAGWLFLQGQFAFGLVIAWLMTFLDSVDGKLARVTVQSSRLGHVLDHGMDIVHPPFWYVAWGMALGNFQGVYGLDRVDLYWVIFVGYILGRLVEGIFHLLGDCEVFTWRPFDAYFRLVTARRNTCLLILTAAVAVGRPEWGFVGVAAWTAITTLVLVARLAQALIARVNSGPLQSWLADADTAARQYPRAYQLFAATQRAQAGNG